MSTRLVIINRPLTIEMEGGNSSSLVSHTELRLDKWLYNKATFIGESPQSTTHYQIFGFSLFVYFTKCLFIDEHGGSHMDKAPHSCEINWAKYKELPSMHTCGQLPLKDSFRVTCITHQLRITFVSVSVFVLVPFYRI